MSQLCPDATAKCRTTFAKRTTSLKKLAADFFDYKSRTYLLVVDYYSWFVELALLSTMTSTEIIRHLRSMFARQGIPDELRTDNGSQFTSKEFQQFVQDSNISHTTSSPLFPQANGMAERVLRQSNASSSRQQTPTKHY